MVSLGLLYQDLIRRKLVGPDGRLPPILPVVLSNGDATWGAAQDVASMVEGGPAGLERYRPRLEYFLLDEGRIAGSELEPLRNVAAALFRLERSREPLDLKPVVDALLEWLKQPEHKELQRSFASWVRCGRGCQDERDRLFRDSEGNDGTRSSVSIS